MAEGHISFKLDLIVHLVDTTTGYSVSQKQAVIRGNGETLVLLERGTGYYILINHGREDMHLEVNVKGYLPAEAEVSYANLSEDYPEVEIPLIPQIKSYGYTDLVTMEGNQSDIESIDAIPLHNPWAKTAGYVERKLLLKLFNAKEMNEQTYALYHEDKMQFEEFRIVQKKDKLTLKLFSPLVGDCKPEEQVTRIIRGKTDQEGNYLLRVREDGNGTEYLVRYVVRGNAKYKRISFDHPEDRRLE
ncbi:MAG: hypothetical protein II247_00620 [Lachnospiraceae bacterium]|nr:hypothetical protein [Lachnospiraceae bacterium]